MRDRVARLHSALPHPVRWAIALVAGSACLAAGLVLLVLPGPGIPLLLLGLLILASEFAWAAVLLARVRTGTTAAFRAVAARGSRVRRTPATAPSIPPEIGRAHV